MLIRRAIRRAWSAVILTQGAYPPRLVRGDSGPGCMAVILTQGTYPLRYPPRLVRGDSDPGYLSAALGPR